MDVKRKKLSWIVTVVLGIATLSFALVLVLVFLPDVDGDKWGRIYKAKVDIETIETAVELYHQRDGRYPSKLDDLIGGSGNRPPLLGRIPLSPWQTPYELIILPPTSGRPYKIWTTPDHLTEERIHLNELSNETDWKVFLH